MPMLCYCTMRTNLKDYFFLCLSFLRRFLRLWVDILCLLCFLPFGILQKVYKTKLLKVVDE